MLRIHQSSSVAAAKSYYSTGLESEGYYAKEGEGSWFGRGAEILGLSGGVEKSDFESLCENRMPGARLKLNPRDSRERKVGYDISFSAPKSVSIMYEVLGDHRILPVFENAVRETMEMIEKEVQVRVRKGGVVDTRTTGNLVGARFTHHTARPTIRPSESQDLSDPALHCHCYVFSTTYDEVERRFKAIELFRIKHDAFYFEAQFHSRLAMGLRRLGYGIEAKTFGFEILGVGEGNITRFSRRTTEIQELAERLGIAGDAKAMDKLGARSRKKKVATLSSDDRLREWRSRIDRSELEYRRFRGHTTGVDCQRAVELAISAGFERQSVVQQRRLLASGLKFSLGVCGPSEIEAQFLNRTDLISKERGGFVETSTLQVLAEERRILRLLAEFSAERLPISPHFECPDGLDKDQKRAVEAMLLEGRRVFVLEGKAGTGKTSLMKTAVNAMEEAGESVFTFAPTSEASHKVLKEEGFEKSETIQLLLLSGDLQDKVRHGVIWVDEAGLLSTSEMRRLMEIVDETGARLILSGDRGQHHSVGRGDALRLVADSGSVMVRRVRTVYRQRKDAYRKAVEALALTDVSRGFELLDSIGSIKEAGSFPDQVCCVAEEYVESLREDRSVLVVAPTHIEGRLVTTEMRRRLKLEGRITDEITLQVHRNKNLTEAERSLPRSFSEGDFVRFHQNAKGGFRKGDVWIVREIAGGRIGVGRPAGDDSKFLDLNTAKHFAIFRPETVMVGVGDTVRLLANIRSLDGKRLYNGSMHKVTGWGRSGEVILDGKHRVLQSVGLIDHGYVTTSHSSQGKTVDKIIVSQSSWSASASSLEQFYVSVSRGRDEVSIWCDNKAELLARVKRSDKRLLASELFPSGPESSQRKGDREPVPVEVISEPWENGAEMETEMSGRR